MCQALVPGLMESLKLKVEVMGDGEKVKEMRENLRFRFFFNTTKKEQSKQADALDAKDIGGSVSKQSTPQSCLK